MNGSSKKAVLDSEMGRPERSLQRNLPGNNSE